MNTIVVTGPESTGKTSVSQYLAENLEGLLMPEYARNYISGLNRKYTYEDVEAIAGTQVYQRKMIDDRKHAFLVLDTWLIITKVWFTEVFHKYPSWLDQAISEYPVDLYLLCEPDIPWIPDPVRENGGIKRKYLFDKYLQEIKRTGTPVEIIQGSDDIRYQNALAMVRKHFKIN